MVGAKSMIKRNKALTSILTLASLLISSSQLFAQESNQSQTTNTQSQSNSVKKAPQWPSNLKYSPQTLVADELKSISIENIEVPVLIYWSKGRIKRGTAIILTAQGESPSSLRFARPLSTQLSTLGWEVIVPTLPQADFATKKEVTSEKAQSADAQGENNKSDNTKVESQSTSTAQSANTNLSNAPIELSGFFESDSTYQDWISKTVTQSLSLKSINAPNNLLIANQESAYWSLDLATSLSSLTQIVLIQPQLPQNVEDDVAEKFSQQKLPVYTFMTELNSQDPFTKAFEKQNWKAKNIRINHGLAQFEQLDLENTSIARTISGWISSQ